MSNNSPNLFLRAVDRKPGRVSYVRQDTPQFILAAHDKRHARTIQRLSVVCKKQANYQRTTKAFPGPISRSTILCGHERTRSVIKHDILRPVQRGGEETVLQITRDNTDCYSNGLCSCSYVYLPTDIELWFSVYETSGNVQQIISMSSEVMSVELRITRLKTTKYRLQANDRQK